MIIKKITIVDYGMGNLLSVARAFTQCGADVSVSSSIDEIATADRLILPGVGASANAMKLLHSKNITTALYEFANTERPFMGICLGMQLLLDASEEFGHNETLAMIPGKVVPIPNIDKDGTCHKVPHIGWSPIVSSNNLTENKLIRGIAPGSYLYFVHSYYATLTNNDNLVATCHFAGRPITAIINKDNLYGCQFHPEKSGSVGLQLLSNFLIL